jgi:sortase A
MALTAETKRLPHLDAGPDDVAARRRRRNRRLVGLVLLLGGVALIGYVGWQYWGTSWVTSRAQHHLRNDVERQGFVDYQVGTSAQAAATETRPVPRGALGFLKIPRLHLDMVFVQGADLATLKLGPGHYTNTPLPGQGGNVAIAGHRTTYLHPFWSLNEMKAGDRITVETRKGVFVYKVQWVKVVAPNLVSVIAPTKAPSLTLTTCNPRFSSSQRLVVRAVLVSGPGFTSP